MKVIVTRTTCIGWGLLLWLLVAGLLTAEAQAAVSEAPRQEQLVRFLAATLPQHPSDPRHGVVGEIELAFRKRDDRGGIIVTFERGAGSFSQQTGVAILVAIDRAARLAGLETASWSVRLAVREPDAMVYGDSLSAMVALCVVALAKQDVVQPGRVVTGTVTAAGELGVVTALPYKVEAAYRERMGRVILPAEEDIVDPPWSTPFLMQVSPVGSVQEAYRALTGAALVDREPGHRR